MSNKFEIPHGSFVTAAKCEIDCPKIIAGPGEDGNGAAACTVDNNPISQAELPCRHDYSFITDSNGYIIGLLTQENVFISA